MATRAIPLTIGFIAWDTANNVGKTGDAANITVRWLKDGVLENFDTPTVTEVDAATMPGLYTVDALSLETDCNLGTLHGVSVTADISIIPVTIQFERLPDANPNTLGGVRDVAFINGSGNAASRLREQYQYIESGNPASPYVVTNIKFESSPQTDNYDLTGMVVVLTQGVGILQTRRIETYNTGSKIATLDKDWDLAPNATSVYNILGLIV